MKETGVGSKSHGPRTSALFLAAGGLLLVQVVLIGLRKYDIAAFSELWIAPFAVAALVAALRGLVGLYPRLADGAPRLAKAGRGAAVTAGVILGLAALWMIGSALMGGVPQPLPAWFLAVIALFMVAFVLSFVFTAAAGLGAGRATRTIGWLLLVPVVAWGVILGVGFARNFAEALKLDFYTNGVIAIAFVGIGGVLRRPGN